MNDFSAFMKKIKALKKAREGWGTSQEVTTGLNFESVSTMIIQAVPDDSLSEEILTADGKRTLADNLVLCWPEFMSYHQEAKDHLYPFSPGDENEPTRMKPAGKPFVEVAFDFSCCCWFLKPCRPICQSASQKILTPAGRRNTDYCDFRHGRYGEAKTIQHTFTPA